MTLNRLELPFRKNCEGYFFDGNGNVLAKKMNGFLVFPGGGVDDNEDVKDAIIRETLEETGAVIVNLKKIGNLKFVWGVDWAKTEKQKKRYINFQGEDMTFFTGKIDKFIDIDKKGEDFWGVEKLMKISDAVKIIESMMPFDEIIEEYREFQLSSLKNLLMGNRT